MEENVEEEVKKKRGFALSFSLSLLRGHLEGENGQKKPGKSDFLDIRFDVSFLQKRRGQRGEEGERGGEMWVNVLFYIHVYIH